jgi:hypothetical protein
MHQGWPGCFPPGPKSGILASLAPVKMRGPKARKARPILALVHKDLVRLSFRRRGGGWSTGDEADFPAPARGTPNLQISQNLTMVVTWASHPPITSVSCPHISAVRTPTAPLYTQCDPQNGHTDIKHLPGYEWALQNLSQSNPAHTWRKIGMAFFAVSGEIAGQKCGCQ